jgi:predicted phage terminase large subunit-like protein
MLTPAQEAEFIALTAEADRLVAAEGYAAAKLHLADFARQAWPIVEPRREMLWNWHLDLICEHLERVTLGECQSLAINIPPRYMKSLLVTVMWPCWEWARRPELRYLFASYSQGLSTDHSVSRRDILESEWYQTGMHEHWGHADYALADDQNLKTQYANTGRGRMVATSMSGTATGQGGDRVVIDDPVNPKQANSATLREEANRLWDQTFSSRLDDKAKGAFVIVMQRLHQSDLTGHVLNEGGWTHLCVPGIAEHDEDVVFPSGRVVHREAGDLLWPERESAPQMAIVRRRLGSYGFAGQYQQRPTPSKGGIIKREDIRYWTRELRPDDDPARVVLLPENLTGHRQSWDFGLWGNTRDDYSVGLTGARLGANAYVLDCIRRRMDLATCIAAVREMTARNPKAVRKVIENAANGPEVVKQLKASIPGLIAKPAKGDKEARLMGVQPVFESGNVFFPHPREAGWVADCLEELFGFPFAEHDDFVDALSQLISDFDLNVTSSGSAGCGGGMGSDISGGFRVPAYKAD